MNADPQIDIVSVLEKDPGAIFTDKALNVEVLVTKLRAKHQDGFVDLSTDKGRRAVARNARSVVSMKTLIDKAGKEMNAHLREKINAVDDVRKHVRESLDALRDEIRKPLTDWEIQEEARIAQHKELIERIVQGSYVSQEDTSASIGERIAWMAGLDLSETALQEFSLHAKGKQEFALAQLRPALERAQQAEAERAELDRLRKQQAEKEAIEAEERKELDHVEALRKYIKTVGLGMIGGQTYPYAILIRELEEKVIPDIQQAGRYAEELETLRVQVLADLYSAMEEDQKRFAAEEEKRRKLEADAAAEAARKEAEAKAEREKQALIEEQERKERERLAVEQREREEAEVRARDRDHRRKVNTTAAAAIMEAADIGENRANKLVSAIAAGEIPNINITY